MSRFLMVLVLASPIANAQLYVSPPSISFFNTYVGSFGVSQTIFVTNNGKNATQVSTTNTCFLDFMFTSFCNLTLNPHQSCTMNVQFQPHQAGYQSCTLYVRDSMFNTQIVNISGNAVNPP